MEILHVTAWFENIISRHNIEVENNQLMKQVKYQITPFNGNIVSFRFIVHTKYKI